ncbi:uncharacterized protein EDB91DRAFT_758767 [Suillus paluster]|uniref:uncharacterized protein n=1 Tax=Suillus paluster TaxID=48578 RepID=UPI001B85C28F|nr:uncharacterized protein EDB91DRAFT_758767 [Suillus paluster]KAG1749683.1 hypothetical protein EDB91DRAFT_758767 [Suillus paluster]
MVGQYTYQFPVCFSSNRSIDASVGQGSIDVQGAPFLRCTANYWVELEAKFLSSHAGETSGTLSSPTSYHSIPRPKRPLRPRSQNARFWTLEDRMKRIQSRTASWRKSALPNLSRRSTIPDLEVLHVHYARQHVYGEAYDGYECGETSPKRKRAFIGICDVNKMLPFVRRRLSYECNYNEPPQWTSGVEGLVDSKVDITADHKMADVKDESCIQSNVTLESSIGVNSTHTQRIVDMIQDLPSASRPRRLPCRDICEAGPTHHNKPAFMDEANESTVNLMRDMFRDGEQDDQDSIFEILQGIRYLRIL